MINQSKGNRSNPPLAVKEITDVYIRENFNALARYFLEQNQLLNFKFLEFTFDGAVTAQKVPHGLGFTPKDVIRSKITGPGVCTFNHNLFDDEFINVSTTNSVRVRCFVGTYFRDASQINPGETDSEDFFAKIPTIPGKNGNITSVVRAYAVQDSDDLILIGTPNDSDFTPVTLPDATLYKGRSIQFQKNDDNFIQHQVLPFKTGQTIDGQTSTTLCSYRERITLQSDGANWRTLLRDYPKEWRSTTYANPSALTNFGTQTLTHYQWRRDGDRIIFKWTFRAGTVVAGIADVRFPTNIRVDTTKLSTNARGYNLGLAFHVTSGASAAFWSANNTYVLFYDNTSTDRLFFANAGASNAFTKLNGSGVAANSGDMFLEISMAVQGWRG